MTAPIRTMPELPAQYRYKAIVDNPHHVMSLEGNQLFFVNCYVSEDEAVARLAGARDGYLMQSGTVRALARYRHGNLVEVVTPDER